MQKILFIKSNNKGIECKNNGLTEGKYPCYNDPAMPNPLITLDLGMKEEIIIQSDNSTHYISQIKECWERRDLVRMLFWRDIKVRYAQTSLGFIWAVFNPLISILLLMFVFNVVAKVNTFGIAPILFVTSGLCAWNYFSRVVTEAGDSIVGAQSLVKKIYFPRLVIPISKGMLGMVDFAVVFILLIILTVVYGYPITIKYLLFIPVIFILVIISLGGGIWISALSIRFRDFHYIVPLLLRIGMFVSPVAYASQEVPARYAWIVGINPITGIMDSFRWILFGLPLNIPLLASSLITGLILFITGLVYFIRMEKYIADIL
jgi:lipopolysaccharide transport system permease protein